MWRAAARGEAELSVGGRPVALSRREVDLLTDLGSRASKVILREQLFRDIWQSSEGWQDTATVTEHVGCVRLRIEPGPRKAALDTGRAQRRHRFDRVMRRRARR